MRTSFIMGVFLPLTVLLGTAGAPAQPVQASSTLLPGPGRDAVIKVCSSCHSPSIIATQRHTPDEWNTIVGTMINRGAIASDDEIDAIENYLSSTYPPKSGASTRQ